MGRNIQIWVECPSGPKCHEVTPSGKIFRQVFQSHRDFREHYLQREGRRAYLNLRYINSSSILPLMRDAVQTSNSLKLLKKIKIKKNQKKIMFLEQIKQNNKHSDAGTDHNRTNECNDRTLQKLVHNHTNDGSKNLGHEARTSKRNDTSSDGGNQKIK